VQTKIEHIAQSTPPNRHSHHIEPRPATRSRGDHCMICTIVKSSPNVTDVNCANGHERPQNVCAIRTMRPPPPRVTIAACGCKKSGGRHYYTYSKERPTSSSPGPSSGGRGSELGGVAKSTGERALQHTPLLSYLLWFLLFLYLQEARHLQRWRGLLPPLRLISTTITRQPSQRQHKQNPPFSARGTTPRAGPPSRATGYSSRSSNKSPSSRSHTSSSGINGRSVKLAVNFSI